MRSIAVLIDFTEGSEKALEQAAILAEREKIPMYAFHFADSKREEVLEGLRKKLTEFVIPAVEHGTDVHPRVESASLFSGVREALLGTECDLCVIGTHGIKGLRQNLFGSNILRLVRLVPHASLVIQENLKVPKTGFKKILFPIGPHDDFTLKAEQLAPWAKSFGSYVELFAITKSISGLSDSIAKNLDKVHGIFRQMEVEQSIHIEPANGYSIGYSRQTLEYAHQNDFDMIAIMAQSSEENRYFSRTDKENVMLNEHGIPVFCAHSLAQED